VLVRNYSGVPGLERCLRVTAGLPEETDAFVAAIKEALDA
jgi:histidinol-phosphate/aromatic aminotransferase/cobyric acid decarboxylase-like protein